MATELDRAYIINGDDLMRALSSTRVVLENVKLIDEHGDMGRPVHAGSIRYADTMARDILTAIAYPLDDSRWPMTRGELETRLSLALEGKDILIDRDPAPGGDRLYVQPAEPGGLAAELIIAIDGQGDDVAGHSRPATPVTVEQLADALKGKHAFHIPAAGGTGSEFFGYLNQPEALAESILEDITGQAHPMPAEPEPCTCPVPTEKCLRGCTGEPVRKRGYYDGKTGMQPFDVIDEFGLDFYEGNCIKYIVRWRKKNGVADLRKARTYIDALIKRAEAESEGDE
jgi:Protein of unknwon function (DUF3310)